MDGSVATLVPSVLPRSAWAAMPRAWHSIPCPRTVPAAGLHQPRGSPSRKKPPEGEGPERSSDQSEALSTLAAPSRMLLVAPAPPTSCPDPTGANSSDSHPTGLEPLVLGQQLRGPVESLTPGTRGLDPLVWRAGTAAPPRGRQPPMTPAQLLPGTLAGSTAPCPNHC